MKIPLLNLRYSTACLLLTGMMSLAGCTAAGALAYKFGPPPRTPAKYKPNQDLAVIIVENYRNPSSSEIEAEQLARLIADEIREEKIVPLVADNAVSNLRDADPAKFHTMSIPAIAKAVGAKQAIYVDMRRSSIEVSEGEQMVRGSMDVGVKIVDAQNGLTRWPADSQQGWPVGIETPFVSAENVNESLFRRRMHEAMAVRISHLFYDWVNDDEGSNMSKN